MSEEAQRLDLWLYRARFFKTRALAAKVVAKGVRVDARRVSKPGATIRPGDTLTFSQAREVRVVRVTALPDRRGPAPEAQACYEVIGEDDA